jgi:hypothetical protein
MKSGETFHDSLSPVVKDFNNPGGGMSASEKRMVNHRGKIIYSTAAPKQADAGKDTSKNAKNKISGPAGLLTKEQSPGACVHSRNQGGHYDGGKGSNAKNKGYK